MADQGYFYRKSALNKNLKQFMCVSAHLTGEVAPAHYLMSYVTPR